MLIEWNEVTHYILALVVTIFAVLGNTVFILLVLITRSLPAISRYFLLSIGIADLLVGLCVAGSAIVPSFTEFIPNSDLGCKGVAWCLALCAATSQYSLMFLCCDRYIAATQPLQYKRLMTNRQCQVTILVNWAAISGFHVPVLQEPMWLYTEKGAVCLPALWHNQPYLAAVLVIFVLIPSLIYFYTFLQLMQLSPTLFGPMMPQHPDIVLDRRLIRFIGASGAVFHISWLPFNAYITWLALGWQQPHIQTLTILAWISISKSCTNILFCCTLHTDFRTSLCRLIRCCPRDDIDTESIPSRHNSIQGSNAYVISQNRHYTSPVAPPKRSRQNSPALEAIAEENQSTPKH